MMTLSVIHEAYSVEKDATKIIPQQADTIKIALSRLFRVFSGLKVLRQTLLSK